MRFTYGSISKSGLFVAILCFVLITFVGSERLRRYAHHKHRDIDKITRSKMHETLLGDAKLPEKFIVDDDRFLSGDGFEGNTDQDVNVGFDHDSSETPSITESNSPGSQEMHEKISISPKISSTKSTFESDTEDSGTSTTPSVGTVPSTTRKEEITETTTIKPTTEGATSEDHSTNDVRTTTDLTTQDDHTTRHPQTEDETTTVSETTTKITEETRENGHETTVPVSQTTSPEVTTQSESTSSEKPHSSEATTTSTGTFSTSEPEHTVTEKPDTSVSPKTTDNYSTDHTETSTSLTTPSSFPNRTDAELTTRVTDAPVTGSNNSSVTPVDRASKEKSKSLMSAGEVIAIIIGVLAAIMICSGLLYAIYMRRRSSSREIITLMDGFRTSSPVHHHNPAYDKSTD